MTDDAANKVTELYVACLAMTFGSNIALDHPVNSKGDNPDVMLDFRGLPEAEVGGLAHG
ncbi:MAG: hypothetical protein V4514_14340 [Pseudomonadota bacterium]|uniref:hypothetical protein n=1 Tax=Phenylobacterium sp. TaxID=1871053 RepID=UPI0025D07875|nr:hypothetical protein [Phenylobacterium sp.]